MNRLCVECSDPAWIEKYKEAGADELIFPLKDMAYSSLPGLTLDEILSVSHKVHKAGMRIAILMTRLFSESEIHDAEKMLSDVLKAQVNAVYFADPGLLKQAEKENAVDKLIYRPETLVTSMEDASWWMERGLQSTVISPLLTKEEILETATHVPHLTLQIHGRMIMSISHRRLVNAFQNAAGKVFQKDNLYMTEEKRSGKMPVYESEYGTIIYTDYIQQSFEAVPSFMRNGIERFEIDADFINVEDVCTAARLYREILDGKAPDISAFLDSGLPYSEGYLSEKTVK